VLFALLGGLVVAAVLVACVMSLFVRRHGESDRPQSGWVPTDEVFRDPTTDRMIRVWSDHEGRRHYVPDSPGAADAPR
jgi:hypothetical protein